jgi:hypothetical protein
MPGEVRILSIMTPILTAIEKRGDQYQEFLAFALEENPLIEGTFALPFMCGMLPLIGGRSVTPLLQARRDQPSRFSCRFAVWSSRVQINSTKFH